MTLKLKAGEKFNRLTFLHQTESKKYRMGMFQCECGRESEKRIAYVKSGNNKSCGKCGILRNWDNQNRSAKYREEATAINGLVYKYKQNARDRKHSFELDVDTFLKLVKENCFYCGAVPSTKTRGKHPILYNGIDRLDSKAGYNVNNCVSCCRACNIAKHTMSKDEYIAHCWSVVHHQVNPVANNL